MSAFSITAETKRSFLRLFLLASVQVILKSVASPSEPASALLYPAGVAADVAWLGSESGGSTGMTWHNHARICMPGHVSESFSNFFSIKVKGPRLAEF